MPGITIRTVADFHAQRFRLTANCLNQACLHSAWVDVGDLLKRGKGNVVLSRTLFKCSKCGSKNITLSVHGPSGPNGEWPDERQAGEVW